MISSPKLDIYKIARQLTDTAIKVNALWGSVGGVLFKNRNSFWNLESEFVASDALPPR